MAKERTSKDSNESRKEKSSVQPDKQTLHKTDPQENMEGPFSSFMHKTGESFETDKTREEADNEREKNM